MNDELNRLADGSAGESESNLSPDNPAPQPAPETAAVSVPPESASIESAPVPAVEAEMAAPQPATAEPPPALPTGEAMELPGPAEMVPPAENVAPAESVAPAETVTSAETMAPAAEEAPLPAQGEAPSAPAAPSAPSPRKREKKSKLNEEQLAPLWEELTQAMEGGTVLTVHCTKSIRGGALVEYKGLEGFIPMSHFDLSKNPSAKEIESVIGQDVDITVIELSDREEQRFVCSRKNALKKRHFGALAPGMVLEGRVTSITDYGVFVDLGGVDGLIHISRLSKVRVNHPSDVVKKNQVVKVSVVDVDQKSERIALSMKEFTESPWMRVAEKYPVGSTHTGKVRNITSFAAYVQLEPGIDGMIHISDLSWTRRVIDPKEILKVGEEIPVKVLEVKPDKERIGLSFRETQPDPWPRLANIYPVGTEADAKIKQLNKAGAIVELHEVDGFVPQGKMGLVRKKGAKREPVPYNTGDPVRVRIVDIDIDNRSLICAIVREEQPAAMHQERRREEMKAQPSERTFTLGDIPALQNFMKDQQLEAESRKAELAAAEAAARAAEAKTAEAPASSELAAMPQEAPAMESAPVEAESAPLELPAATPLPEAASPTESMPEIEPVPEPPPPSSSQESSDSAKEGGEMPPA